MEILLHLGGHKTGSTVLQQTLCASGPELAQSGITYPRLHCDDWQHRTLFEAAAQKDHATILAILESFARSTTTDTLVISSEYAQLCDEEAVGLLVDSIGRIFSSARVRACLYVRRQDELFDSLLNQQVKLGRFCGGLQQIISDYGQIGYYARYADIWARSIGKDVLQVRDYASLDGSDIISDFASVLKQPLRKTSLVTTNVNLAPPLFELKRRCNRFITTDEWEFLRDFAAIMSDVSDDIARVSPPKRYVTTDFERATVLAIYADDNQQLFAEYLRNSAPWEPASATGQDSDYDQEAMWASLLVHLMQYIDYRSPQNRPFPEEDFRLDARSDF